MTITIVGAGMAGLLAANMLQRHSPRIIEAQGSLPNNHSAVLRFGSDKVAEVTGIPFKKVRMIKGTIPWRNPIADALSYAKKCGGTYRSDRSMPVGIERAERWIAPPDLIMSMALGLKVELNTAFGLKGVDDVRSIYPPDAPRQPVISTMPMPALMELLKYPDAPEFNYVSGANLRFLIDTADAYATLYIPDPFTLYNRISITGNEVIAEFAYPFGGMATKHELKFNGEKTLVGAICQHLGVKPILISPVTFTDQQYAKIQPIDDIARKKFLAWATDNYNIFSLGRFATWRPGLLLDDLVHDIRQIEKWINDRYAMKFAR